MAKKVKVSIPKGSKDCNGAECDKNYEFDLDIPETTVQTEIIPTPGVSIPSSAPQQVVYQQAPPPPPQEPKEKEDPHEKLRKSLPRGINFAKCEGGDCGHQTLKNPKQTHKHKACPNCKFNGIPKNNDICPNCGLDEENKEVEWEDSDIEIEEEEDEDE